MADQIKEIKELLFTKNVEPIYEFIVDDYKTNLYTNVVKILSQNKVQENQAIKSSTSSLIGSKLGSDKKKCQKDSNQEKNIQQIVTRLLSFPFTTMNIDDFDKIKYKKTLENGDVVAVVQTDNKSGDDQCRINSFNIGKITKKSSTTLGGTKYEISILDGTGTTVSNIQNQGEKSIISLTIDSNNLDDNVVTKTDDQKKDKSEKFLKEATNKDRLDKILDDNNSYDKIISNLKVLLSEVEGGATGASTTTAPSGSTACNIKLELKKAGGGNKKPNIIMELREKNTRRRKQSRRHKYRKSIKKNRKNKKKQTKKLRKHRKKTYKRK